MDDLIARLLAFEGSDDLGNGDFSLMQEAAAALRAAREAVLAEAPNPPAEAQPDWEAAPPGATHYQPRQDAYYKRVSASEWYVWSRDEAREPLRWLPSLGTRDNAEWVVRPAEAQPLSARQEWYEDEIASAESHWIATFQERFEDGDDVPDKEHFVAMWLAERTPPPSEPVGEAGLLAVTEAMYLHRLRIDSARRAVAVSRGDLEKAEAYLSACEQAFLAFKEGIASQGDSSPPEPLGDVESDRRAAESNS